MEDLRTILEAPRSMLVAIGVAALLCVLVLVGIYYWRKPVTIDQGNAMEVARLEAELAASRTEKAQLQANYEDSMAVYRTTLATVLADTLRFQNIQDHYDQQRENRRALSPDSALLLLRYRLRIEPDYSKRFKYSTDID